MESQEPLLPNTSASTETQKTRPFPPTISSGISSPWKCPGTTILRSSYRQRCQVHRESVWNIIWNGGSIKVSLSLGWSNLNFQAQWLGQDETLGYIYQELLYSGIISKVQFFCFKHQDTLEEFLAGLFSFYDEYSNRPQLYMLHHLDRNFHFRFFGLKFCTEPPA